MEAGKLRHKATIYSPSTSTNSYGEIAATYTSVGEFYCAITTLPKKETTSDQVTISKVDYNLTFRYNSTIENLSKDAYIMLDSKKLHILAISHVKHLKKMIQIVAEERT